MEHKNIEESNYLKVLTFSYSSVIKHLTEWINYYNSTINDSICFIDCGLSDFDHNLSFSLILSPFEDESKRYLINLRNEIFEKDLTVGGHFLFKIGLPCYNQKIDKKADFDNLKVKTGYKIGFLIGQITNNTYDIETKAERLSDFIGEPASEALAYISSSDDISLEESFDTFVEKCCNHMHDKNGKSIKYVYGIPICRLPFKENPEENDMCACIFLGISNAVSESEASQYVEGIRKHFNETILPVFFNLKTSAEQTKSAIGSIMSRNGSHNIGSHVLSQLSHNVGTMPDDRMLYQYIQHRMDYIATATTDFPQWTTPTMFVGGLMKNFYAQKHLLNYISRSEGLSAYKFQERNLDDATRMNQYGTIRIFLRRFYKLSDTNVIELPSAHRYLTYAPNGQAWSIYYFFGEKDKMFRQKFSGDKRKLYEVSESGGTAKFLEYDERFSPDWKQDVRMAIPGGIVGQHAFYTIIENVVRNAAKHGWASENNMAEKDLEIFIDFRENKDNENIEFTISDNVSDVFGAASEFWSRFFEDLNSIENWYNFLKDSGGVLDTINKFIKGKEDKEVLCTNLDKDKLCTDLDAFKKLVESVELHKDINELNEKLNVTAEEEKTKEKHENLKQEIALKEAKEKELNEVVKNLIKNLFVDRLSITDAKALDEYLRDNRKDDEKDDNLPLIYLIQREYILKHWKNLKNESIFTSNKPSNPNGDETDLGRRLVLPLHHDQQRKLAQSFIDSNGKLRKENWGLAEMKISAGYLLQRSTSEIGGLEISGNDILFPVATPGVCRNPNNQHNCLACSPQNDLYCYKTDSNSNCPLIKNRFHLGYRFKIAKPKDILAILEVFKDKPKDISSLEAMANIFAGDGIHFAYSIINQKSKYLECYKIGTENNKTIDRFNYRFVVVPKKDILEMSNLTTFPQFSFRCIYAEDVKFTQSSKENNHISFLTIREKIKGAKGKNASIKESYVTLRKAILSAWVQKLAEERYDNKNLPIKLILNVDGNENGSERGLITNKDLLQTMFVECYHTALISFLKNPPQDLNLSDTTERLISLLSLIKVIKMEEPQQDYGHGSDFGAKEYIRKQLGAYCNLLKTHLLLSPAFIEALKYIEKYVRDAEGKGDAIIARKIEDIDKDFEKAFARRLFRGKFDEDKVIRDRCEDLITFLQKVDKTELDSWLDAFHGNLEEYKFDQRNEKNHYRNTSHSFEYNLKAIINTCSVPEEIEFNALVESLNSMFLASDVYLRKYEERIATLPEAYKHDGSDKNLQEGKSKAKDLQEIADELLGVNKDSNNLNDRKIVKYSRHDNSKPENSDYSEALSGSQSYLNALSRLVYATKDDENGERYAAVTRLLENAFLRILIIDERVMNFVNEHRADEMVKKLINMGIWIGDVEHPGKAIDSKKVNDALYKFTHYKKDEREDYKKDEREDQSGNSTYIDIKKGWFDVLVIHQGIIDKWWERHDQEEVANILNDLRISIPRVVVTTGRGRPENIPETEKVLPFSIIESTLFKGYPEKLMLVNAIMNLLPYGHKN